MAAELTGLVYSLQSSTQDDSVAVTVPADADICIVIVTGWPVSALPDALCWDNGDTMDFALITSSSTNFCGAYYMASDDANWPGSGSQTLYRNHPSAPVEGSNLICVFFRNVDISGNPIVDFVNGYVSPFPVTLENTALTGIGADDLSILACSGNTGRTTYDAAPSGFGQTELYNSAYNSSTLCAGYEVGEDVLRIEGGDYSGWVAFALSGTAAGGTARDGNTTVIGVGLVDSAGSGARSAAASTADQSAALTAGSPAKSAQTDVSASSIVTAAGLPHRSEATTAGAFSAAAGTGRPEKNVAAVVSAIASATVAGLAEEVSEGTGTALVSAASSIEAFGASARPGVCAVESWAGAIDAGRSVRSAAVTCSAAAAVGAAGTATEANAGIVDISAVSTATVLGLPARSGAVAVGAAALVQAALRSGRSGATLVVAAAGVVAAGTFTTLGVVDDPSTRSVTVQRTTRSLTVQRTTISI